MSEIFSILRDNSLNFIYFFCFKLVNVENCLLILIINLKIVRVSKRKISQ